MPARIRTVEPEQIGERRVTIEKEGTTAYLKLGVPRAGGRRPGLLPAARARRRAHRREGLNLWSTLPHPPPQRSARLYRALVEQRPRVVGVRRAAADRAAVPLHGVGDGDRRRAARGGRGGAPSQVLDDVRRERHHGRRAASGRSTSCARGSCSRTTASPTSRTSSGTSRRSRDVDLFTARGERDRRGHARRGRSRGRVVPACHQPHRRLVRADAGRRGGRDEHARPGPRARLAPRSTTAPSSSPSRRATHAGRDDARGASRAGSGHDPADRLGLAHFVSRDRPRHRRADGGRDRRRARQPRRVADSSVGRHLLTLVCTCLAEDFDAVLALLGDIVRQPTFPDDGSRDPARARSSRRSGRTRTTRRRGGRGADGAALPGRASVRPPHRRAALRRVESITRDRPGGVSPRAFAPGGLTVVIVGDVDRRQRASRPPSACSATGTCRPRRRSRCRRSSPAAHRQRLVIPMMNKAQADIAYGFTTITRRDPDYYAVLADEQRARPVRARRPARRQHPRAAGDGVLRVQLLRRQRREGPLVIRAGVSPANVDRAIASIDEEVARIVRDGVTARSWPIAKQYLIGSMPRTSRPTRASRRSSRPRSSSASGSTTTCGCRRCSTP